MIFTAFLLFSKYKQVRDYSETVFGTFFLSYLLVSKIHLVFHCHTVPTADSCMLFSLCAQGMEGFLIAVIYSLEV